MARLIRKLTLRELVGSKSELLKAAYTGREGGIDGKASTGNPVAVAQILGRVNSVRSIPNETLGTVSAKLTGEFEGVNLLTGEVLTNANCILPNFVSDEIVEAIKAGGIGVQFGVKFFVKFDEKSAVGYVFEAESLMKPRQSSGISALRQAIESQGVALAGVTEAPKLTNAMSDVRPEPEAELGEQVGPEPESKPQPKVKK